jgi:energy-coupling factor transporter ATP-binding protein EcfA2
MQLTEVTVQRFRNFVEPQTIEIEPGVTGLVGKNESGKTTVLKALHRLNPANGTSKTFDLTLEYPRWRLSRDRRNSDDLSHTRPVQATFDLDADDLAALSEHLPVPPPTGTVCMAARTYGNHLYVWLRCPASTAIEAAAKEAAVAEADREELTTCDALEKAQALARERAKALKEAGADDATLRAKALTTFAGNIGKYEYLMGPSGQLGEAKDAVIQRLPRFFYFSSYDLLPGTCDLTKLAAKDQDDYTAAERTVVALLAHAGENPQDFLDEDYDSRKAELQAASTDLTRHVFQYWRTNTDLSVVFDTDNVPVGNPPHGPVNHRILHIELRDARHGDVETNFDTRSTGFQWFFSFFAAFSEHQESDESLIVLLDEPGTSLHGEAQRDFIRYINDELGASKQTIYTTHSQFMVDPTRYESLRAVHDRATKDDPDLGVVVTNVDLSADRDTVLPVESALGYTIAQHLFLGSGQHLAVEGSSDFVYLQRMTEDAATRGEVGLDPRLSVIPVGGADNMPVFVALLGRRLHVSALVDGDRASAKYARVKRAAENNDVPLSNIVTCGEVVDGLPKNADIEDLFATSDYLRLFNWAFDKNLQQSDLAATEEPIIKRLQSLVGEYDHALPAHALTDHREEFFASIDNASRQRFAALFQALNATVANG